MRTLPARTVLALTIWGEARGEPRAGRIAVGWVIKNRAAARKQSISQVCLDKWQFSCWWGQDANAQALRLRAERLLVGDVIAEPRWLDTLQLAHQVLVGAVPDPTRGADHYLTTALYEDHDAPTWARAFPVVATIGRHTFLKDDGARRA
jgi:spore germination cell wall hydrolase CwlJ-like protein